MKFKSADWRRARYAILTASLLTSCEKNEPDGQFILRGQLMENCSETPASGVPMQAIFYWGYKPLLGRAKNFSAIVGTGQTDSMGRIEIPCDYHGDEGQVRLRVNGRIYDLVSVEIENREYDMGTILRAGTFQTRVRINTTRTFALTDTLFLAVSGKAVVQVSPIVARLTAPIISDEYAELRRDEQSKDLYLRWGIGREAFNPHRARARAGP